MASADDPSNAAAANIFNEDEDLLDDDDDEESSDHDEDDSASSAAVAVDRPPPSTSAAQETIITKKAVQPDESRKLFQRLWTDEDEIELLQGFFDYTTQRCGPHNSSQHHHDTTAFYDQIRSKFQLDFNKNQLVEKLRRLKKKYRNVMNKFGSGKDYTFKSPHDQATFEISSKIWGSTSVNVNVNGSSAFPTAPAPIEEDDDDINNPNFAVCQSPKPNGIDINSKTPRPRKRNRAGALKVEDKQHHATNSNINNTQPSVTVTPMAAPVMGTGITGSMSNVIEETVKSCLSPIFKELLCNSMSSTPNPHGLCCGHGFELARSQLPLCFAAAMGGDKMANNRWRKQQILELEVFSKRLELVQDQIREQLQELRSIGN
ncbi:hypothetical protein Pfo_005321 [Paulownia fortunei]|nr:hypothetical protein Pfo_005321 [Paulownia fortunei]